MKITEPGIYPTLSAGDYYADPCPSPSFTQSLAKIVIDRSPLHAWHAHPRLNPDYQSNDDTKFDLGNVAHSLLLGRGKDIVAIDADDWRTKEAKAAREKAKILGQTAVLGHQYARADRMVRAAIEQLPWFRGLGNAEVCLAWQERGIWCRQLIDWLEVTHSVIIDYKTTGESAAPHMLGRKMHNDGWHIQAAMADRALAILSPENIGRREYRFIVQETDPPYQLMVATIGEAALTIGRQQLDYAIETWAECINTNRFPGYPNGHRFTPEFPGWAESQWMGREIDNDARRRREPMVMEIG